MLRDNDYVRIIAYAPVVFVPIFFFVVALMFLTNQQQNFEQNIAHMQSHLIKDQKNAIKTKVDTIAKLIIHEQDIIENELLDRVQNRVKEAHKIATAIFEQMQRQNYTPKQIQQTIIEALRPLTWNEGESFIWILNYDGIFQLAPTYLKHLEGKSIIDFQDAHGRYVIQEEIAMCKNHKEGFLWDTFTKPNEDPNKQFKQLAFVEDFGHFGWYFGSGEYLDTATKQSDAKLLQSIAQIGSQEDHYFFLIKTDGTMLLNRLQPELVGKNLYDIDDIDFKAKIEEILSNLQTNQETFATYKWLNPKTGKIDTKSSFFKLLRSKDIIIGSGYYQQEIDETINKQKVLAQKSNEDEIFNLIVIIFLVMIAVFIISYFMANIAKNRFMTYQMAITEKNKELEKLNESLELKVSLRTKELEETKQQLEVMANTDELTKLDNRYAFERSLNNEIKRAQRYGNTFALMVMDIDHFKSINDNFGHDAGDSVLKEIALILTESLRDVDSLCRIGGEEFAIILPSTNAKGAYEIAERIRLSTQKHTFIHNQSLTLSVGICEYHASLDKVSFVKLCDNALYSSKQNGRNQTTIHKS
jgi:diguanylate cyclase (GGDEF)-like protein